MTFNFLPVELLSEIANQKILTNKDLANLARVNHRSHEAACARLYRSGELSYVGATKNDAVKVDSYGKNGKFVRILKLNLFSLPTSPISIPTAIFPLLTTFVNLHRIHLTDSASLSWPSFLHVLAIIITSHPYLKILEVQRTLTKPDGRSSIPQASALIESHKANKGRFSKLDIFILRLSKKEEPYLISRAAMNNLITILTPATRSAKAFTYSSDCWESADIDLKGTVGGDDRGALAWEWDNLEELTLKFPEPRWFTAGSTTLVGDANPSLAKNLSFQRDLGTVKRLALRTRDDLLSDSEAFFIGGISVMPNLEYIRMTQSRRGTDWNPKPSSGIHPFHRLAEEIPNLKYIEQTDPYYLTRRIQCLEVIRNEDGTIKFQYIEPEEPWIGYYEWDQ
ncbi:hypothetical protein TWF481_009233 [Arthrobotrys musiformis]|uniref:F-box domain-containing protein n=1 Tax=Arthrobotrys musiformis TaxID=47236 RepID=A0AAV9W322_9PEZI